MQKAKIRFDNVFDAQKHVTETGLAHQRRKRLAVICDRRGHRLDRVIDRVQAGLDDRVAQPLEAFDVQREVVVDDEDAAGSVVACVADVGEHAVERKLIEVSPAHLDDRAEAAVERAAARGFDGIGLPA